MGSPSCWPSVEYEARLSRLAVAGRDRQPACFERVCGCGSVRRESAQHLSGSGHPHKGGPSSEAVGMSEGNLLEGPRHTGSSRQVWGEGGTTRGALKASCLTFPWLGLAFP